MVIEGSSPIVSVAREIAERVDLAEWANAYRRAMPARTALVDVGAGPLRDRENEVRSCGSRPSFWEKPRPTSPGVSVSERFEFIEEMSIRRYDTFDVEPLVVVNAVGGSVARALKDGEDRFVLEGGGASGGKSGLGGGAAAER